MSLNRADDIGDTNPSDTGDVEPTDPITLRQLLDYLPGVPDISVKLAQTDDPEITVGEVAATGEAQRGLLKEEGVDVLIVATLDSDDNEGLLVVVAKGKRLKRTPSDGKSVGGITYVYTGNSARTSVLDSDATVTALEEILPPYLVDFDEIKFLAQTEDADGVKFYDTNADGRAWAKVGIPE